MIDQRIVEELRFLLDEAEKKVWRKAERVMLNLYWQLGYCLRDYSEEDIAQMEKELAFLLHVEKDMFATAHRFYKENPLKKRIKRLAA